MNVDQLKGLLLQFKGEAKRQWGKLTEDDWKVVEGDADTLAGRIQERYGNTIEAAKLEIEKLFGSFQAATAPTVGTPNGDQLKGKWKQLTGELKRRWGKLTDDEIMVADGDADALAGRIQEHYGKTKEAAKREIDKLFQTLR